jgi:DNA-binding NarL/FixJ family response regulator
VTAIVRPNAPAGAVLIVDDQRPFRAAARAVIDPAPDFTVVGEAESGEEAVIAVARWHPDVVLMDVNLPGISGIEATRQVLAAGSSTQVVLMSTYPAVDLPADAWTCGALAVVLKEDLTVDVLRRLWTPTG